VREGAAWSMQSHLNSPTTSLCECAVPSSPFDKPDIDQSQAAGDASEQPRESEGDLRAALESANRELQRLARELELSRASLGTCDERLSTALTDIVSRDHALARANGDLNNLLNAFDVAVLILDGSLRIRLFSPAARRLFALAPDQLSQTFSQLPAAQAFPDLLPQIEHVAETLVGREFETRNTTGQWHRIHIRPYKCSGNTIDGLVVCAVDINTLKHHVREAQEARAQAERGNRERDDFLGVLSHELRTPLASIMLHTQMLRRGEIGPSRYEQAFERIERSARMQAQLIEDLLDASRIVAGKLKLEVQAFELCPVVLAAVEGIREAAKSRAIALEVNVGDDIGEVWSDPGRVGQVVRNLLGNALKFTPVGGKISLELSAENGFAALRVSDNGAGIGPEFLPYVFDRLVQQESTITRRYGGLGLGLAIVRHVVETSGGTVSAESGGVGRGSTFKVTFPLTGIVRDTGMSVDLLSSQPLDRPGRSRDYGLLHGLRVLVLDDDPGTLEAILEVFRLSGAVVQSASSVSEALLAFEAFGPQMLVCDIAMPESDGYAFIRKLRARGPERGGDTPALALTALSSPEDRRRAIAAGYQNHMAKPVDIDRLRDMVVELLKQTPSGPRIDA
jgi:two-component system CheB/CheR fusion protein